MAVLRSFSLDVGFDTLLLGFLRFFLIIMKERHDLPTGGKNDLLVADVKN